MTNVPYELMFLGLLVLANGVLAMTETAVVSASRSRLRELASEGDVGAVKALKLSENPTRFLTLVEFWLTLSSLIAGMFAGVSFAGRFGVWLAARVPWMEDFSTAIALAVVMLGLTGFMLVFGEFVPKRIGLAHPEKVASLFASSMGTLAWIAGPLLKLFELCTDGLVKMIGLRTRPAAESVGDDAVRALIEQGLHAGVFHHVEKEMMEGVLELDQLPVTALMTPRPKIVFLNLDDPDDVNWRKIVASGHSYFPVYQTNRDQVVGMVAVKALWAHSAIGLPTTLKNLLVPPLTVPETMTAIQLLEQFKKSGKHIAVVADEFGVVQGLVTLIDVLEAIVGALPEPGQRNQPEAKRREDGSWLIDATLPTGDLKALLGAQEVELPHEETADFQTLGGFVITQFGRIPAAGDCFEWGGWRFEVVDMDRRRVDKVLVGKAAASPSEEKAAS